MKAYHETPEPTIHQVNDLDLNATYNYADYLSWQFEEMVELIKGKVYKMSPAPGTGHQRTLINVVRLISNYLHGKECQVFVAPMDVRLRVKGNENEEITTVVQPDLFVVCDPEKIDEKGCLGSPDFIIEIISPSTSKKDLTVKFNLYEEVGVQEYWIVFPLDKFINCYTLTDGKYTLSGVFTAEDQVPVKTLGNLVLEGKEVFS
jgi:Uma2 family endonuclease